MHQPLFTPLSLDASNTGYYKNKYGTVKFGTV